MSIFTGCKPKDRQAVPLSCPYSTTRYILEEFDSWQRIVFRTKNNVKWINWSRGHAPGNRSRMWHLVIVSSWWTAVAVLQICWAFSGLFPLVSQFDVGIVALKLFGRFRFEQGVGDQTSPVKTRHVQNHILSRKKSSESYFNVSFYFVTFDCPAT